jgi:hypothetical protein
MLMLARVPKRQSAYYGRRTGTKIFDGSREVKAVFALAVRRHLIHATPLLFAKEALECLRIRLACVLNYAPN